MSHTMDELQSIVTVNVDTSGLDDFLSFSSGDADIDDCLMELKDTVQYYKTNIETGATQGAEDIAQRLRSLQELTIATNMSIQTGALVQSIDALEIGDRSWQVGTILSEFYPLCIEYGRGPVVPVNKSVLRWFVNGEPVFSKYSSPTSPKPFVEPSFNKTVDESEELLWGAISNAF